MNKVYRPLLVMHPDPEFRERVREACGADFHFQVISNWDELEVTLRGSPPAAVALAWPFESWDLTGQGELSPRLQALLRDFPSLPVLAALPFRPERHADLRRLGRWGVVQIVSIGHDDTPAAISSRLRSARGRPLLALIEKMLPMGMSGRAHAIIAAAVEVVIAGEHGRDLARSMQLSRRTLLRWCQREDLPVPRRLLAWMRVLHAAELLDDPGRSVLGVAHTCGYSSDSGLRRITQNFLGQSPSELRKAGAFEAASRRFLLELDAIGPAGATGS